MQRVLRSTRAWFVVRPVVRLDLLVLQELQELQVQQVQQVLQVLPGLLVLMGGLDPQDLPGHPALLED